MLGVGAVVAAYIVFFYLPGDSFRLVDKALGFSLTLFLLMLYAWQSHTHPVARSIVRNKDVAPKASEMKTSETRPMGVGLDQLTRLDKAAIGIPAVRDERASAKPLGKVTYYQAEAHVISHLLQKVYELPCKIMYNDPNSIRVTHNYVAYKLTTTGAMGFHELLKITGENGSLAQEVNRLHRGHKHGEVRILAVNSQPPILQVTRANPKRLEWSKRPDSLDSLCTCFGEYMKGMTSEPLIIDMAGRNSPYVVGAFIGASRSGKSAALHVALCQLLENSNPDDIEIYGIDVTAADTFRQYNGVPHFKSIASDPSEALAIVEQFNSWCITGKAPDDEKVRLLVIDECQELLGDTRHGEAFLEKILKVAGVGGKLRLRMWMVTQNPDSKSYPEALKGKTHFWAYTHMLHDKYLTKVLGLYGARELTPQTGDIIFKGPFEDGRVTTYWLTDEERAEAIENIVRKWAPKRSVQTITREAPASAKPRYVEPVMMVAPNASEPMVEVSTPVDVPVAVEFPIPHRPPTPHEVEAIVKLALSGEFVYRGNLSMNRLIRRVWKGDKNKDKCVWIKEVLSSAGIQYSEKE